MSKKLNGKIALVTGASKGIGASIAKHLANEGATIIVNYSSSKEGAEKIVADIVAKGGKASALQANLSKESDIKKLFEAVKSTHGHIDILINNAGIYEFAPIDEVTKEHFDKLFDLNVLGLILTTREAIKYFNPKGGSIVNISSLVSVSPLANSAVYSATKAAVDAITKTLSKELGSKNIRVNAVNPGMVETEGTHDMGIIESDLRTHIEKNTPLGRIGKPEDIAPAVVFFASDEAAWITGETLVISGGYR